MDAIEKLAEIFERFPGIGPRQAQRFVQFLLRAPMATRHELARLVEELSKSVMQCPECMRWYAVASAKATGKVCSICSNQKRDVRYLMVVASDADLAALEASGTYTGRYFVLGGTLDLASDKADRLRIKQLLTSLPTRIKNGLEEVILAFPANPEGDATAVRVREEITGLQNQSLKVTTLGRGLSTGSELEYADPETIKSAFEGRK